MRENKKFQGQSLDEKPIDYYKKFKFELDKFNEEKSLSLTLLELEKMAVELKKQNILNQVNDAQLSA